MPEELAPNGQLSSVSLHDDQHPLSMPVRADSLPVVETTISDNKVQKGSQDTISRHYMSQAMRLRTAVTGGATEEVLLSLRLSEAFGSSRQILNGNCLFCTRCHRTGSLRLSSKG